MRVPDRSLTFHGKTQWDGATLSVKDLKLTDTFAIFNPVEVEATVSFDITWTPVGRRRFVRPGSSDPTDPTNFFANLKDAIATGSFTASSVVSADDPTAFSITGAAASSEGIFAIIGREKNGRFLDPPDDDDDDDDSND